MSKDLSGWQIDVTRDDGATTRGYSALGREANDSAMDKIHAMLDDARMVSFTVRRILPNGDIASAKGGADGR